VQEVTGKKPKAVDDFRTLLDDRHLDAVVNATPHHWHALGTILTCQAGKDVYVEKPACHSLWEGRKIVEAARKYNRVVQLGTQNRSSSYGMSARELIKSGKLGDIHLVRVFNSNSSTFPTMTVLKPITTRQGRAKSTFAPWSAASSARVLMGQS
jgi:predicted dehydrogenase